jgi:arginase
MTTSRNRYPATRLVSVSVNEADGIDYLLRSEQRGGPNQSWRVADIATVNDTGRSRKPLVRFVIYLDEDMRMRIEVLGTPFNGLESSPGTENPADGLRQVKLLPLLESKGHSVADLGDLSGFQFQGIRDLETGIQDFDLWIDISNALSRKLGAMLERESFPLLLGGDCSMLVGILSAFAWRDTEVGLIFLDGHADFHSPETSPSGDPADMELAILTGRGPERITRVAGKYPLLKEEDVVVYGIRAWDQIAESNIQVYDRNRMAERGIKEVVEEGLESFTQRGIPLWLHFDVDALDPKFMPVMFPESGGLTFEETREFLSLVWASGRIVGMSIACYHPVLDTDGSAGARLVTLIVDVLSSHAQYNMGDNSKCTLKTRNAPSGI